MLNDEAISAGIFALSNKAALALGIALILFNWTDRRQSKLPLCLLTCLAAIICVGFNVYAASQFAIRCAFAVGAGLLCLELVLLLKSWVKVNPASVHDEQLPSSSESKASNREKRKRAAKQTANQRSALNYLWLIAGCVALAIGLFWQYAESTAEGMDQINDSMIQAYAAIQMLSACLMLGVSLFCAMQVTFLSSPDALEDPGATNVLWGRVAATAMLLLALALFLAFYIFLNGKPLVGEEILNRILPTVFALTLVILYFVAWMVPYRIYGFQKSGKAKEWTSLALAAWLSVLCFALVCALPTSWPWQALSS